jgi:fatty-acyl-CoA synthase
MAAMSLLRRLRQDLRFVRDAARTYSILRKVRPDYEISIADFVEDRVAAAPHRLAILFDGRKLTNAELEAAANRVARWASAQGIGRGDVVGLLMENRPEYVITWLGLAKLGAVTALLNTNLRGNPLAHSLDVADAKHLIVGAELGNALATAQAHAKSWPTVWGTGGPVPGARDLDAELAMRSPDPIDREVRRGLKASDKLFYIYTSGTTGLPKAANVSHLRACMMGGGAAGAQELGPEDRVYVTLPLYHSAGGVMAAGSALMSGGVMVLARKFSASRFWSDCRENEVTSFQYIGELCRYLLHTPEHPDEQHHRIRVCIGNGLRPEIWEQFQERFNLPKIIEFYGATEGNVALMNLDGKVGAIGRLPRLIRGAMGVALIRYDVAKDEHVRGPNGFCIPCKPGEVGEAIGRITAVSRFEGYSNPEATEKKILRNVFKQGDVYFRTGDLMRLDADDYFYFVDRIGDTFRWKGENVSTNEVAEVLSVCPGVKEANVYGVAVPGQDGRAGMAALVVDDRFDPMALAERCARELPAYARPLFLRLLPQIEVTGTFKHRKVELVKEGFDPAVIANPLYFLDGERGYVPLDAELHGRIVRGEQRV